MASHAASALLPAIGLEVHAQLRTATKAFCGCQNVFGGEPNTHLCPVCLGLPGALPVLNREAVVLAALASIGLGCTIQLRSQFARKHYFYPDLPKGYQITQTDMPLAKNGWVCIGTEGSIDDTLECSEQRVRINRVHIEEDAGKSVYRENGRFLDFNRAGVPLVEIVTAPDMHSGTEAAQCLAEIRAVLIAVKACDGNMEAGSLRCDVNVSLRIPGEGEGVRVEVKNINSLRFVKRAVDFEIERQRLEFEAGRAVICETRGWDEREGCTFSQRVKENSEDYRYIAEPDLPPLVLTSWWVEAQSSMMPELPSQRRQRYQAMGLSREAITVLSSHEWLGRFFDDLIASGIDIRMASSFLMTEVLRDSTAGDVPLSESIASWQLVEILRLVQQGAVTARQAKELYAAVRNISLSPFDVIAARGMRRTADEHHIKSICERIVLAHPLQVKAYREGKSGLLGFFMGRVMKETDGSADPRIADKLLRGLLTASDSDVQRG